MGQQLGHEYLDPYYAHGKYRSFEEVVVGLVTRLTAKEVFVNSSDFFIHARSRPELWAHTTEFVRARE